MNIRRLVLGTAAGALAVTGAQAADLPVVVEPVEYVRVCDAYGEGYYFIPGTETCLRVAGRIRADYQFFGDLTDDDDDDDVGDIEILGGRGYENDTDLGYRFRARAYIYMDSRTSTEFGLLRTFTELQVQFQDGDAFSEVDVERAFIQFGGLTFGNTRSFFDFSDAYYGSFFFFVPEVSDQHTTVLAYTAAFGNGFSASISIEDQLRRAGDIGGAFLVDTDGDGVLDTALDAQQKLAHVPDLVANIRIDQGWGSAQVMGMLGYREVGVDIGGDGNFDESDESIAFAIGAGVNVNVPFGNETTVGLQGTYSHGAIRYATSDGILGVGDGVIDDDGDIDFSDAFSIHGGAATSFTPTISGTLGAGFSYAEQENGGDIEATQLTVDGAVFYSPVPGFVLGVGLQYRYADVAFDADDDDDDDLEGSALAGFFRAQRTF
ncbi:porin [Acuticoccus sp.]|uniref:porin n=1 Tax=Acuticoccus sp. TaxID=1904378 RepID=UPI003B518E35